MMVYVVIIVFFYLYIYKPTRFRPLAAAARDNHYSLYILYIIWHVYTNAEEYNVKIPGNPLITHLRFN